MTSDPPAEQGERPRGIVAKVLVGLVRGYQMVVSPWFAPRCRYYPSCSQYAVVAVSRHGVWRGTGMAIWRVLRCNPWSLGGVDHVPEHPEGARTLLDSPPVSSDRPHRDGCGSDQT